MSDVPFETTVQGWLDEAAQQGFSDPVVLLVSAQSPRGCAIFEEVIDQPMEPLDSPPGREFGVALVLPKCEAVRLLRAHCGNGGEYASEVLVDPILCGEQVAPDIWYVGILRNTLAVHAVKEAGVIYRTETPYDRVRRDHQSPAQLATDPGPSRFLLDTADGTLPVYGPTGREAVLGAALAKIVSDQAIEVIRYGQPVRVALKDDNLASLLACAYSDDPRAIAEAIMALRKRGKGQERWLNKVLWGRPELRPLARAVWHELTGE